MSGVGGGNRKTNDRLESAAKHPAYQYIQPASWRQGLLHKQRCFGYIIILKRNKLK
jgi:hypothetical protein